LGDHETGGTSQDQIMWKAVCEPGQAEQEVAELDGCRVVIIHDADPHRPKTIELWQGRIILRRMQSTLRSDQLRLKGERWLKGGEFNVKTDERPDPKRARPGTGGTGPTAK
jgi:hypothetical protein